MIHIQTRVKVPIDFCCHECKLLWVHCALHQQNMNMCWVTIAIRQMFLLESLYKCLASSLMLFKVYRTNWATLLLDDEKNALKIFLQTNVVGIKKIASNLTSLFFSKNKSIQCRWIQMKRDFIRMNTSKCSTSICQMLPKRFCLLTDLLSNSSIRKISLLVVYLYRWRIQTL